jgi:hypothetical protein
VKKSLVVLIAALPALIASPAAASVTLGQLAPGVSPPGYFEGQCGGSVPADYLQQTVTAGNSYVVPGPGTITSWSHNAGDGTGMTLTFKVFRHFGGALFTAVGHSGPFPLLPSTINTFPTHIPVSGGDIIGLRIPDTTPGNVCDFTPVEPEDGELSTGPDLADGQSGAFAPGAPAYRVDITAVFEPSNSVTVGKIARNAHNGTATLTISVPNPGELTASGKGVNATFAGAMTAKSVTPGNASLTIRAKGKLRKQLVTTGKVKLKPTITFTPTNGVPGSQQVKVKLRKR